MSVWTSFKYSTKGYLKTRINLYNKLLSRIYRKIKLIIFKHFQIFKIFFILFKTIENRLKIQLFCQFASASKRRNFDESFRVWMRFFFSWKNYWQHKFSFSFPEGSNLHLFKKTNTSTCRKILDLKILFHLIGFQLQSNSRNFKKNYFNK